MAMWSFVPPFRDAKFYGVPSGVFDKLESATGEKWCKAEHSLIAWSALSWIDYSKVGRIQWKCVVIISFLRYIIVKGTLQIA